MTTEQINRLCAFVNSYLFSEVWNTPYLEHRYNIIPISPNTRSVVGTWSMDMETTNLPTALDHYFVYMLPKNLLKGLEISSSDWTTVAAFQATSRLQLRIHGTNGELLFPAKIFIRDSQVADTLLIAIDKKMFRKILPAPCRKDDIFIGLYYDSDTTGTVTTACYQPTTTEACLAAYAAANTATTIIINGREAHDLLVTDISIGDYVVLINDQDIDFTFDLDLTHAQTSRTFLSERDGHRKYIVHIPKALNPTARVITNDTCDIYIRPKNSRVNGLYLHRCQAVAHDSLTQITYNDFAIPMYLIDAYCAALAVEEVTLHIQVRTQSKDNILIRDAHYTDLLYALPDTEILDILEGQGPANLQFWTANQLEQSGYVRLLEQTPSLVQPSNVVDYVDALGYYQTLALICPRVRRYVIDAILPHTFNLGYPAVLTNMKFDVVVFINGLKLKNEYVSTAMAVDGLLTVTVADTVPLAEGDALICELFESSTSEAVYQFAPKAGYNTLEIAYDTPAIYELRDLTVPVVGVDMESSTSYIARALADVGTMITSNGISTITFNSTVYGKLYIIQNNKGYYKFSVDIAQYTDALSAIAIPIKTSIFEREGTSVDVTVDAVNNASLGGTSRCVPLGYLSGHYTLTYVSGAVCTAIGHTWNELVPTGAGMGHAYGIYIGPGNGVGVLAPGFSHPAGYVTADAAEAAFANTHADLFFDGSVNINMWYEDSISGSLSNSGSVIFRLVRAEETAPILSDRPYLAFMNGYALCEGVDYHLATVTDSQGNVAFKQLLIQGMKYLQPSNNIVEIIIPNEVILDSFNDFIKSTNINTLDDQLFWCNNLSQLSIDGVMIKDVTRLNGLMTASTLSTHMGGLMGVRTMVPAEAKAFIDTYHIDDDLARYRLLCAFFRERLAVVPPIIVIDDSYQLYSIYLNNIIRDVIVGTKVLNFDPVASRMLSQVPEYEYLKAFDLVFTKTFDLRFIDLYPLYQNHAIDGIDSYNAILRLVAASLPADTITDGDTVHE